MNSGKVFEGDFKASVPSDFYMLRLKDPAVAFSGGMSKFAPNNPYDYLLFKENAYCIELKTSEGAITFWSEKFAGDGKKRTYEIKEHQIKSLEKAAMHEKVYAGLLLNFRKHGRTIYVPIHKFLEFVASTDKKSINCDDAISYGFEVESKLLKVHYRYNINKMCEEAVKFGKQ